jgi:hypothetical protein
MPIAQIAYLDTASPQIFYIHPDQLNRPVKMTDASQNVAWDSYRWPCGLRNNADKKFDLHLQR